MNEIRSGLTAIKTLLSRDPCGHATTAIQMIDAMLAEQTAQHEPYCYTYTENGEEYFAPPKAYVPDDATPLYTSPPAQQEPVKWVDYEPNGKRYKSLEEKLKDAFYEGFTSSATYNDIELNDVDEEWLKYATAQGITKGNT